MRYAETSKSVTVYQSLNGIRYDTKEEAERESQIHMLLELVGVARKEDGGMEFEGLTRDQAERLLDLGIVRTMDVEDKYLEEMERRVEGQVEEAVCPEDLSNDLYEDIPAEEETEEEGDA